MAPAKILLTGASGYIGGAVLADLLSLQNNPAEISALVRSAAHRDALRALGITPVHFDGLQDLSTILKEAAKSDIVISCASAMDEASCLALVEGLGQRKEHTGNEVYYIHTSGTSNFGDHPISGAEVNTKVRSDKDDIYTWESTTAPDWITRKVDVAITDAGERLGVKTIIVNPPLIYGTGDGPINQRSLQIPALIKLSLHENQGLVLGEGKGIWALVHIADVAAFYGLLVRKLLSGETINHGRNGYHFLEAGETTWLRISQCIAEAGHALGLFFSAEVRSISPEDMKKALDIPFLNAWMVEVIWGSNSRIIGEKSRELGWAPQRGATDFYASFGDEVNVIASSGVERSHS